MSNLTSVPFTMTSEMGVTESTTQSSLGVIHNVYPPILILVGVTCNILIILIMRTKQFCRQSTAVFMTTGAVNDALGLLISMTTHWLHVSFDGIYYQNEVKDVCRFLDFYGWGNCDFGILITSTMTVDRALAMTFPLKVKTKSVKRARVSVVILLLIVVAKEFHFLIGSNMVPETRKERLCDVYPGTESYRYFWKEVWPWLHLAYLSLCFITIIVSNIVLVIQIIKSSKFEESIRKDSNSFDRSNGKDHNKTSYVKRTRKQLHTIAPMLIGESVVMLILTFPFSVQLSVSEYNPEFYRTPEMALLFSVTFYLLYTNKCVTFFVYLVTGSKFRESLKQVFWRCLKGKRGVRRNRFNNLSQWYKKRKGGYSRQGVLDNAGSPWNTESASKDTVTSNSRSHHGNFVSTHL